MRLKLQKSNKGSSLIIVALLMTTILGFSAIVVDVGRVSIEKTRMQNAIDSCALAAAQDLPDVQKAKDTVNQYIVLNGFTTSDITIDFSDSNKEISITGSKKVDYTLGKIFGLTSTTLTPHVTAACGNIGEAFDFALFSGSKTTTLTINGSNQYVGGSSHTNKNFVANGSKITITGACEAMTTVSTNGSQINIDDKRPNSPFVAMPDFSETLKLQAQDIGQYYTGNKTYSGGSINIDQPIYVNGNVTVNGSKFQGKGCIIATGNIIFNGSNLNESTSDAVCFYSQNGNITVNGSHAQFDGILYAPNGSITMNGSNQTVNGRVIGKSVTINGSNLTIQSGTNELKSLPTKGVKLIK